MTDILLRLTAIEFRIALFISSTCLRYLQDRNEQRLGNQAARRRGWQICDWRRHQRAHVMPARASADICNTDIRWCTRKWCVYLVISCLSLTMLYKVYIRRGLPRTVNTWLFASSLVEACVTDWVSFVNGNSLRPSRAPNAYKVDSVRLSRVETFCGTSFWSNTAAAASWNRRAVVWKRLVGAAAAAARLTSPRVSVETLQLLLCTMEYLSLQSNNLFYILFEAWQVVCRKGETEGNSNFGPGVYRGLSLSEQP